MYPILTYLTSRWAIAIYITVFLIGGAAATGAVSVEENEGSFSISLSSPETPSVSGFVGGDTGLALGESATFGEGIEVKVTDSIKTEEMELIRETGLVRERTETTTFEAPSGGTFVLFRIEVNNTDVTRREAPVLNIGNYDTLEEKEDTIHIPGVNDIRVYGSGEGGYLPDGHTTHTPYERVSGSGVTGPLYPQSPTGSGPQLGPDDSISGWVYGVIEEDTTPELRINFDGSTVTWVNKED